MSPIPKNWKNIKKITDQRSRSKNNIFYIFCKNLSLLQRTIAKKIIYKMGKFNDLRFSSVLSFIEPKNTLSTPRLINLFKQIGFEKPSNLSSCANLKTSISKWNFGIKQFGTTCRVPYFFPSKINPPYWPWSRTGLTLAGEATVAPAFYRKCESSATWPVHSRHQINRSSQQSKYS